jgi:ubiquitin carboxyl-terminal hydrolase 1
MSYHGLTLNSFTFTSHDQYDFTPPTLQRSTVAAIVGSSIFFLYFIFPYLGPLPLTVCQYLWNILIYMTPSRIVAALDAENKDTDTGPSSKYSSFHEKEQAMRRIIGFDKTSLDSILPRARRLSSFGNAFLGSREYIPPGLGNWDNSCYQNSVIQGLASLQSFSNYLDRNINNLDARGRLSTLNALRDTLEKLNDPENHGQKFWIPSELKSMSSWQQQDAQEYFSKIADQLDREVREASRMFTTNPGLRMNGQRGSFLESSKILGNEKLVGRNARQLDHMHNPLEGLLAQRVGCTSCGWTEGLSLIPFNCLTVSLGRKREYDIRECLDDYMALETIEGVECAKCTLLRAQDQLSRLLSDIVKDNDIGKGSQVPNLSSTLKDSAEARLQAVREALDEEDFTEKVLSKKCHIPSKNRVSATKSRQAVIARAPSNLVIHVNRSVFDEETGALRKNHAEVRFPAVIDLGDWCLGTRNFDKEDSPEVWDLDPQSSMLPIAGATNEIIHRKYELRAVLTHFGRHENGHYICFRKFSSKDFPIDVSEEEDSEKEVGHRWFRLSDEDVRLVSEQTVFGQGGVFMLFYECVDETESDYQSEVIGYGDRDPEMQNGGPPESSDAHANEEFSKRSSEANVTTFTENGTLLAGSKICNPETPGTGLDAQLSSPIQPRSSYDPMELFHGNVKHQEIPSGRPIAA